jgi:uncharacterized protein YyaL (SSP411 family)
MEHESFEDPEIGAYLNEHFVSIKVDREERPDIDQIYMTAVQIMTQHGGWPMSVFLTPDLKPFYGGTYFPPRDLYGRPSFRRILEAIVEAWQNRRGEIDAQADDLTGHVQTIMRLEQGQGELSSETLKRAAQLLRRRFDAQFGGFGQAPKFPHPMDLRLLLRLYHRFGDNDTLAMARKTLDHMARGGMYDQLGGGFHRYSTDARWLVPHFEKMLYDNALLAVTYLEAHRVTGDPFYRRIVEETLDYVLREMTSPEGAFYSTQDADSEGEEGKFFVWSEAEIRNVLGEDADFFSKIMDVTPHGNWEGANILNRARSDEQEAHLAGIALAEFQTRLQSCKERLLAVRNRRVWPGRDDKILTSWNGLMIAAFAQAYEIFERPEYLRAAERAADFILRTMRDAQGRLLRTTFPGEAAKLNGYLEDYTYFLEALVALYQASFEPRWLRTALEVADVLVAEFWDETEAGFFYTGASHERLIARGKDPHDNATPSGNGMAVTALLKLAVLTGRADLRDRARKTLDLFRGMLNEQPLAAAQMLCGLDFDIGPTQEVVLLGRRNDPEWSDIVRHLRRAFHPRQVLVAAENPDAATCELIPLLAGREAKEGVTVYLCENGACQAPVVGLKALRRLA